MHSLFVVLASSELKTPFQKAQTQAPAPAAKKRPPQIRFIAALSLALVSEMMSSLSKQPERPTHAETNQR